jgi:hypothetical protein
MPAPTLTYTGLYFNGPGFLYTAPVGSTLPANTVTGGVFTDVITTPFIFLGPTDSGSDWSYTQTDGTVEVAESLDVVKHTITSRTGSAAFSLANYTASNLALALNGASKTVTGTTGTTLTKVTPVQPGQETRSMLLWESNDSQIRKVAYSCLYTGDLKETFNKQPAKTVLAITAMFEIPASGVPQEWFFASTTRG